MTTSEGLPSGDGGRTVEASPNRRPESGQWASGSHKDSKSGTLHLTGSVAHGLEAHLVVDTFSAPLRLSPQ